MPAEVFKRKEEEERRSLGKKIKCIKVSGEGRNGASLAF